jgi:hypothetical protein
MSYNRCSSSTQVKLKGERIMYPIDHFDTLHREREELLRRAEYERLVSQEMSKQGMNQKFPRKVANWLGVRLVSWGEKLEQLGTIAERQPAPKTTTQVPVYQLSKTSPHH